MFLAAREMRRSIVRFSMLTFAIGLLVFLVLFQTAIRNALVTTFIGGISNQSAPVMVLGTDAIRDLSASVIPPDAEARIRSADGVAESGRIGLKAVPATAGGVTSAVTVVGYENAAVGAPTTVVSGRLPTAIGEVIANASDAADGFAIGDKISVLPTGYELVVVGQASDIELGLPTLFSTFETYVEVIRGANPDATDVLPNAIALAPSAGVTPTQLTGTVNGLGDDLDALTKDELAAKTPGVSSVKTSFLLIFIIFAIVVPLVTGLFFLIVTFQKAGSLTLLRAIGIRSSVLVRSLLAQVLVVVVVGVLIGIALYTPLTRQKLGDISLRFETTAVIFWSVLFIVLGLASSLIAARRVLAIDPIEASTGAGGSL